MAQFGTVITNIGLAKIANAQITQETVGIKHMVLGDGNGAYYTLAQSQTSLKREVWRGMIADEQRDPSNPNRIAFSAYIPSTAGGFTIREVGLLDTAGNLIAVSLYPEQYKPQLAEGVSDDLLLHFVLETSNASVVTLAVDPTIVIASRKYVDDKVAGAIGNIGTNLTELQGQVTTHLAEKASGSKWGHVKIGGNISVNDGVISIPNASGTSMGVMRAGDGLTVTDGVVSGKYHVDNNITVDKAPGDFNIGTTYSRPTTSNLTNYSLWRDFVLGKLGSTSTGVPVIIVIKTTRISGYLAEQTIEVYDNTANYQYGKILFTLSRTSDFVNNVWNDAYLTVPHYSAQGEPEGVARGIKGARYTDTATYKTYKKTQSFNSKGWVEIGAEFNTHEADKAKHNQFMHEGVLHQISFGYNPTLGCMTHSIREVV